MIMKTRILILFCLILSTAMSAQDSEKMQNSYNYKRAVEFYNDNNYEEAERLFRQELSDNPKNGYASYYCALISALNSSFGVALKDIDVALKLLKKDKSWLQYSYSLRGKIYDDLEQQDKARADFDMVVKTDPSSAYGYLQRADYLCGQGGNVNLKQAENDYAKVIEIEPGNSSAYVGRANILMEGKKYDDAKKMLDYAIKLDGSNVKAIDKRAECLINIGKYAEAADDAIFSASQQERSNGMGLLCQIADSSYIVANIKLKSRMRAEPNNGWWWHTLALVQQSTYRYAEAVDNYKIAIAKNNDRAYEYYLVANCYYEMGDQHKALDYCNQAIERDSDYTVFYNLRSEVFNELGRKDDALADLNKMVELSPKYAHSFYHRAWFEQYNNMQEEAVADLTTAISLSEFHHYYLTRANVYSRLGGDYAALAKEDYKRVIELDTVKADGGTSAMYAYFYLGQNDKALELLNNYMKDNGTNEATEGKFYNAACLYSLMGETDKAFENLRTSLEKGYYKFAHIRRDFDLDNIRKDPRFESLLKEFEDKLATRNSNNLVSGTSSVGGVEKVSEIPFTREGGVCKVKCEINALPLYFIFDTGASDVSISSVEASFMMKNGYLSESDIIGKQFYGTASGEISEGTVINLKSVTFGGLTLSNVRASVAHNQKAPLLLGQSVMQRLGRIEIDNEAKVIRIRYTE